MFRGDYVRSWPKVISGPKPHEPSGRRSMSTTLASRSIDGSWVEFGWGHVLPSLAGKCQRRYPRIDGDTRGPNRWGSSQWGVPEALSVHRVTQPGGNWHFDEKFGLFISVTVHMGRLGLSEQ
jgi:hypothetical protein